MRSSITFDSPGHRVLSYMPTIEQVASAAGVSTATVSRTLSNPEIVREPTRRKVQEAIRKLGYSPNAAAKILRTLKTSKLLVTVPDIANPFFSLIIQGIEDAAQSEGYAVLLGDTHHDLERESQYALMLPRREADGLIFLGHRLPKTLVRWMRGRGKCAPVVNACEYSARLGVPSAHIDNAAAGYLAMDHLYGLGHRHVGIITGPLDSPLSRDRLRGVRSRARESCVEPLLATAHGDFSIASGHTGALQLLAAQTPPTAIFCFNDEMAIGVMEHARQRGLDIPNDLSIVGFDDIRFSQHLTPPLTTINQPMLDIGKEAVRLLLTVIRDNTIKPRSVTLAHRLVIRESTAAPRRI
jgi:LacI family transcriptional regulator, repressor for deo operon, udp, cdd, tsx, nupC, and nupG